MFGYGSLVERASLEVFLGKSLNEPGDFMIGHLRGYRRSWNVSSDSSDPMNSRYYVDETGGRIESAVAALGIYESAGTWINGVLIRVDAADLRLLDRREKNYNRVEVTDRIECEATDRLTALTYVPKPESVERTREAQRAGRCVVAQSYFDLVETGFRQLGDDHLETYRASSDPLPCPTAAIRRVDR